jgi:uncharacterized protein (UPF0276 family)
MNDRVGLGWRGELAAGILAHFDRIDVVEVIADDYFDSSRSQIRALRTLSSQIPVVLHGVSLGLASSEPVARRRVDKLARLVDALEPAFWSEHLAFVRGGGIEIGHLAAPPRNAETLEGIVRNVETIRSVVGSSPLVENVATLIDPPGSTMDEATWVAGALRDTGAGLLLDLHNLHANATNFRFDPLRFLDLVPPDRITAVHLAGGAWIREPGPRGGQRLLDDHLHDVPDPVYGLLKEVARRSPRSLTVILERDGAYPPMAELLAELERAREALREGRASAAPQAEAAPAPSRQAEAQEVGIDEALLARLYTDAAARARFLAEPRSADIDRAGLELAARSFARKRAHSRSS